MGTFPSGGPSGRLGAPSGGKGSNWRAQAGSKAADGDGDGGCGGTELRTRKGWLPPAPMAPLGNRASSLIIMASRLPSSLPCRLPGSRLCEAVKRPQPACQLVVLCNGLLLGGVRSQGHSPTVLFIPELGWR
jgi:hypothetical protein